MSRPTYLTIDLQALQHNLQCVREFAPQRKIIAMVKANAYGHGLTAIAKALPAADAFGVASLDEGLQLRQAGITQPIILMEGLFHPDEMREAEEQQFTLVVHHLPHVEMLEKAQPKKPFSIWLKINTGMNRLGIAQHQAQTVYQRLTACAAVAKPIGLMTHFAEADSITSAATQQQIKLFQQVTASLQGPHSLANSAGILAWPDAYGDWVRPGLILYGASPFSDRNGVDYGLKPVMTLSSQLIAVYPISKGSKVGYGGTWEAPEDLLLGVVGVGYGDGYPQFATNGTPVLVNGVRCTLVGRVSMDMLTVDLRPYPQAKISDPVILWGAGLSAEEVARHSHTSAYEILTRMTPRPKLQIKV